MLSKVVRVALASPCSESETLRALLQLRILRLGLLQDGNVRVGVFPEGEEIFVGGEGPDAGGGGIRSLRSSRLQGVGTSHSKMCQRACPAVLDNTVVVENLLKLSSGSAALSCIQVCLSAYIHLIEARNIVAERNVAQFDA